MAIQGRFEADFSQFKSETSAATAKLVELETQSKAVAGSFASMTSVNTAAAFNEMNAAAGKTTNTFTALGVGLGTTDKTLALLGVHLGPEVRALEELGTVAAATTASLGPLGIAAIAVSTAFAAWKIFQDLPGWLAKTDTAVANTTAKIMGWGDVAKETADAKLDVLNRATKLLQDVTGDATQKVTDFAEAQRLIAESMSTAGERTSAYRAEVAKLRDEGKLEALTEAIKAHAGSARELAFEYGTTTAAVEYYTERIAHAADMERQMTAAKEKAAEAQKKLTEQFVADQKKLADEVAASQKESADLGAHLFGGEAIENATKYANEIQKIGDLAHMDAEHLTEFHDAVKKGADALKLLGDETSPLALKLKALAEAADAYAKKTDEATAANKRMMDAFKASGGTDVKGLEAGLVSTGTSALAPSAFSSLGINARTVGGATPTAGISGAPVFDYAAQNAAIAASAALVAAPPANPYSVVNNTFHVNGTPLESAQQISDILARNAMVGNFWATSR